MGDMSATAQSVIMAAVDRTGTADGVPRRVAEALCEGLPVDAVTLSVLTHTPDRQLLHATDSVAMRLEELQFELEEGPCLTASATGRAVFMEDLHGATTEWPLFGSLVREQLPSVAAIYAFPLVDGGTSLGAVDMLRSTPGPPGCETESAAREAVRAATLVLLTGRAAAAWQPGSLMATHWQRTHQAAGVLAQYLGITVDDALARLRARALGSGRTLPEVTEDALALYLG